MQISATAMESSMEVLHKTKNRMTTGSCNTIPGDMPEGLEPG
jgi:hypothetical protein